MPEPVSPPEPTLTSIDTTLGRIFAAAAATEPAGRTVTDAPVEPEPRLTVCGADVSEPETACATTPPIVPPSTAATAATSATIVQPGGVSRQRASREGRGR